jgi:hypothetical protein
MRVVRIGSAVALALLFGGSAASAQVAGTGANAQSAVVAGTDGNPQSGGVAGTGSGAQSSAADGQSVAPSTTPPPPKRGTAFNRVTTTRRVAVPAPSQAARVATGGGQGAAPTRAGALRPYSATDSKARDKTVKNSGVPIGSSWRQQGPERTTRPPASATRSVTHSYYPGLRSGQYANSNTAKVAKGRSPAGAGMGMGGGARSGGGVSGHGGGAAGASPHR